MNIALLGGAFNPPHVGHLLAAHYVRATQAVDELWLLPSFHHPFGKALVDFEHRVHMCQTLCEDTSGWMKTSRVEQEIGGEGRTVDTLSHLLRVYPEHQFTLVIGSDILGDLPHWKDFARIEQMARVLVIHRAGHPSPRAPGPPLAEVSSTQIRVMLERGEAPTEWVPQKVLAYAQAHQLYALP